ncbi:hypothetical protein RintRC_5028 [Richelia intracellularis]|nr:hypothetical protein RintRC_5028 [Richelia intracellularis]
MHAKIEVIEYAQYRRRGRPRNDSQATLISHIQAKILPKSPITIATEQAGRFILPTNVLDADKLATKMLYLKIRHNNLQNVVFGLSKTHCFLLPLCF